MGRNLSTLFISSSYQFITQISGSELQDGLGNKITGSLLITSSRADTATTASFALTATSASYAVSASQAQNAVTASFALNVGSTVSTASLLTTASAATNVITFTKGDASTFTVTVATGSAVTVNTGSLMVTGSANANILTFTKGDGSTFALTVATGSAVSASFATTASLALNNVLTASSNNATITFTKGDATTFTNVINNVVNATSASFASTASKVSILDDNGNNNHKVTFVNTTASSSGEQILIDPTATQFTYNPSTNLLTVTASLANTAISASYALNATSASFAPTNTTGSFTGSFTGSLLGTASYATQALTASFASTIANGLSPTFLNATASNVLITGTASVALLYTTTISSSVIYSSGSNQFGDDPTLDTQTLFGLVRVTGSLSVTGSADFANGLTGSLLGTASFATSALSSSYAVSASQAQNAVSASFAPASNPFPFTGSALITGSLGVTGSVNSIGSIKTGGTNTAAGSNTVVLGGTGNDLASNDSSFIIGGDANDIQCTGASHIGILGGNGNTITTKHNGKGYGSIIVGGFNSTIGGSSDSTANYGPGIYTSNASENNGYFSAEIGTANCIIRYGADVNNGIQYSVIAGGNTNTLGGLALESGMLGGKTNTLQQRWSAIIGGNNNQILDSGISVGTAFTASAIIGGFNHTINQKNNSVIIGGNNITATADNTVYVPNFDVSGSSTFKQSSVFTGSVRGNVTALTITSQTASLDCSLNNFYTLTLVSGSTTFVNPSNILPGQTINLRVKQASVASGSISFASSVKQVSGSAYTPTGTAGAEDIVTFISFDSTNLYLSNIKNFV
jgi:hypothetical protein